MCQLTYIQINNETVKKLFLTSLLKINAKTGHNDGYGVTDGDNYIKYAKSSTAFGLDLVAKFNNTPLIAHVRKASVGFANKLNDEFTHPFVEDNNNGIGKLICAHNGTLYNDKIPKDMIDSQYFTKELYRNIDIFKGEFVTAFENTIKDFYGKFAFMFNYNGTYYIARGRTATLFYSDIKIGGIDVGFCINTELDSLNFTLDLLNDILYGLGIYMDYEAPKFLQLNSLYRIHDPLGTTFESSVTKVENTKFTETDRKFTVATPIVTTNHSAGINATIFAYISAFMTEYNITLGELDHIFFVAKGCGLLESATSDFDDLVAALKLLAVNGSKNRIKMFAKMLKQYPMITREEIYSDKGLEFPHFLSTPNEIEASVNNTYKRMMGL